MNLLENYVKEIHSVTNVTEEFTKYLGYKPNEPLFEVDLTTISYGITERTTKMFWKSDFDKMKTQGYYMG